MKSSPDTIRLLVACRPCLLKASQQTADVQSIILLHLLLAHQTQLASVCRGPLGNRGSRRSLRACEAKPAGWAHAISGRHCDTPLSLQWPGRLVSSSGDPQASPLGWVQRRRCKPKTRHTDTGLRQALSGKVILFVRLLTGGTQGGGHNDDDDNTGSRLISVNLASVVTCSSGAPCSSLAVKL